MIAARSSARLRIQGSSDTQNSRSSSPSAKGIVTTQTRVFHAPALANQSPNAIQARLRINPTMTNAVHQRCSVERYHRIDQVVLARGPFIAIGVSDIARLNQRRVQVKVVRHHGRPEDADGHVQAVAVQMRHESGDQIAYRRLGPPDL